nr:MAG TPA: hypothetical protein [Caudoviricetes sp.]
MTNQLKYHYSSYRSYRVFTGQLPLQVADKYRVTGVTGFFAYESIKNSKMRIRFKIE